MFLKKIQVVTIAFLLFAAQGIALEQPMLPPEPSFQMPSDVSKNNFVFLGAGVPGGGVSFRTRENCSGRSWDVKVGFLSGCFPTVAVDYNFFTFFNEKRQSGYLSWGIGGVYGFIPYVPVRCGYEFKHGFVDAGFKVLLFVLPIPEIRAGLNLDF